MRATSITFTSNGSWTCPADVTSVVVYGNAGEAGSYTRYQAVSVVPGTGYAVTLGASSGGSTTFGSLVTWQTLGGTGTAGKLTVAWEEG